MLHQSHCQTFRDCGQDDRGLGILLPAPLPGGVGGGCRQ